LTTPGVVRLRQIGHGGGFRGDQVLTEPIPSNFVSDRRRYGKILPHPHQLAPRGTGFIMAMYESDITQFLKTLKQERPALESEQREGRSLLWDKAPIDLEERERAADSRVAQKPYVYSLDN